jgi:hypothetical protein
MYGVKQSFIVARLSEERKRAALTSMPTRRRGVVSRYKDDREPTPIRGELLLQFEAGHPGHVEIENRTIWTAFAAIPKEILGKRKTGVAV